MSALAPPPFAPPAFGPHSALILHADDFGMSTSVNRGIVRGFAEGVLTSTSLLVNAPDARSALSQWKVLERNRSQGMLVSAGARNHLGDRLEPFDLGLHLNLTQGCPLTEDYPSALRDKQGRFPGIGRVFGALAWGSRKHVDAVARELRAQWVWLISEGVRPTHVNGHQYIEMIPAVAQILPELCDQFSTRVIRCARESGLSQLLRKPRRHWSAWLLGRVKRHFANRFRRRLAGTGLVTPNAFFGTAHAGLVDEQVFASFLRTARTSADRSVEIGLHPGDVPQRLAPSELADGWFDPLAEHRPAELAVLCSAEIVHLIDDAGYRLGRLSQLRTGATREGKAA